MATMKLLTDAEVEAEPTVKAVFDDIRATRKSDFVNNFWRGLANDPALLKRTWEGLKAVMMVEGARSTRCARDDLHRGVDCERLRPLHSFAFCGGPRAGHDRCAARRADCDCRIGGSNKSSRHSDANSGRSRV